MASDSYITLHAIINGREVKILINAFEPFKLARFASINTPNANSYFEKANGCFYILTETVEEVWGAINDARGYFVEPF